MKRLLKVMAAAMAFIMAVSLAAPLQADAAKKPKLNVTSRTVYAGGCKVIGGKYKTASFTLKFMNRPKKYETSWTSSDPSIAKVEKYGKYRGIVTGLKVGTATITCEYIDKTKAPYTKKSLTCKVTVKKNCAAVEISPESVSELEEGQTVQLTGTMYDSAGRTVTTGNGVTDTIKWTSNDEDVATVDSNGLVTAVGEGTATISCYTVPTATGKYSKKAYQTAEETVKVTVKRVDVAMTGAKQESLKTFTITFGKNCSKLITADKLTMKSASGTNMAITSLKFASDGLSALATTPTEMDLNDTYTISLPSDFNAKDGKTITLKTSNGVPAKVTLRTRLSNNRVVVNQMTAVLFSLYDANGVDITPEDTSKYAKYITLKKVSGDGYVWEDSLNVMASKLNGTVTISGTYANGTTTIAIPALTINGVDEASTVSLLAYTITKENTDGRRLSWGSTIHSLSSSDSSGVYRIVAKLEKADGTTVYSDESFPTVTFENATANFVSVENDGTINIVSMNQGTDTIRIKYGDTILSAPLTVTLGAERVPKSMVVYVDNVEATAVKMSDAQVTNPDVRIKIVDNYGEIYTNANNGNFQFKYTQDYDPLTLSVSGSDSNGYYMVETSGVVGNGASNGKSYPYTIVYTEGTIKVSANFVVSVYTPDTTRYTTPNYRIDTYGDTDMVITPNFDFNNGKQYVLELNDYRGGIKNANLSLNGGEYTITMMLNGDDFDNFTISEGKAVIKLVDASGSSLVKGRAGSYTYVVKNSSNTEICRGGFVLKDSQSASVSYTRRNRNFAFPTMITSTSNSIEHALDDCFNFYYGGSSANADPISGEVDVATNQNSVYYKWVNVTGTLSVNGSTYEVTIPYRLNATVYRQTP